MIVYMFSVYDGAVKAYLPPFFARAKGEAIRSFSEACNNAEHNFNKHAKDYSLYELGAFDDASGTFQANEPVRVISAQECLVSDDVIPFKDRRVM